jgi:hypothetical protein
MITNNEGGGRGMRVRSKKIKKEQSPTWTEKFYINIIVQRLLLSKSKQTNKQNIKNYLTSIRLHSSKIM